MRMRQRRNKVGREPTPELFIVKNDQPGAKPCACHGEPANQKPNASFHTRVVGRESAGSCSLPDFAVGCARVTGAFRSPGKAAASAQRDISTLGRNSLYS